MNAWSRADIGTMTTKKSRGAKGTPAQGRGLALLFAAAGKAPEWVHLLEKGSNPTIDGRGPYAVDDLAAIISTSLAFSVDGKMPIDINHAIDTAAPEGRPSPAMGWIVELAARDDGLWGRVEWTPEGEQLPAGRSYRYLSPAILYSKDNKVIAVLRASLVNWPALHGLTPVLNSPQPETDDMEFLKVLLAALQLPATGSEDDVMAKVKELTEFSTSLAALAVAVGCDATAKPEAVLLAAKSLKDPAKFVPVEKVAELTAQITTLSGTVKTLQDGAKRDKATAFIDAAILAGKAGIKPLRDHYIERHMQDAAGVEKEVDAMVVLSGGTVIKPKTDPASGELDATELQVAALLGVDPKKFAETKKTLAAA